MIAKPRTRGAECTHGAQKTAMETQLDLGIREVCTFLGTTQKTLREMVDRNQLLALPSVLATVGLGASLAANRASAARP